jgi:2-hydroxy-3-oxopropionate reductase
MRWLSRRETCKASRRFPKPCGRLCYDAMPLIGFIGLGIMGKPMARNLLRADLPVIVHNRSRPAVDELAVMGARIANSARQAAEQSDMVITMLPDSKAVERVIAGPDGIFEGARAGLLIIDMGTTSPRVARQLAEAAEARGLTMLDAPVSGGQVGAQNAMLTIMVGGRAESFELALPVLRMLGSNVVHVGAAGAGQIVKAANQAIVGVTIEAIAEALVLVVKAGVDPARARQAMLGGFASSRVLELHGERMIKGNFVPGGRVRTHVKDLQIALELAAQYKLELPLTEQAEKRFQELVRRGRGDDDHSALVTLLEEEAGVQIASVARKI